MSSGDGRLIEVAAERVEPWLINFERRHGTITIEATPERVVVTAADGTVADMEVPFPPLPVDLEASSGGLVAHILRPRRVGVLLVRLGGYAAGVFDGDRLLVSKVGSRLVHGRSAAGGQSQQRFARRREGQARVALQEAADVAVRILVPVHQDLDAVVTGGDRSAVGTVLADSRLTVLRHLLVPRHLSVPDPRLRVLTAAPRQFRAVRVRVVDPAPGEARHHGHHRDAPRPPS